MIGGPLPAPDWRQLLLELAVTLDDYAKGAGSWDDLIYRLEETKATLGIATAIPPRSPAVPAGGP